MFSVQLWYILYDMVLHALTPCPDVPDVAQDPQELTDQIERIQQLMEEEIARLPGELTTSDVFSPMKWGWDTMDLMGFNGVLMGYMMVIH